MCCIHAKLLGNFIVTFNGKTVSFPYNKVQALFFYLLIKKQCSREEVCELLWSDMEEKNARKNLRNALYKLKKTFDGEEILSFSNKSTIRFSDNVKIEIDVDEFINNEDSISTYSGEFLKGYMPKGIVDFQSWIIESRRYFEGIYLKRLNKKLEDEEIEKNYENIEKYCKLIIKTDEFNEKAYRNLMKCYKDQGNFNAVLRVYDELSITLKEELSIVPDDETTKIFKEALDLIDDRKCTKEKFEPYFYGRINELAIMENDYKKFIENKNSKSILIRGEMGIGKTRLKERFLKTVRKNNIYVFETNCYQFENDYILKPWKNIVSSAVHTINNDKIKIPSILKNIMGGLGSEVSNGDYSEYIRLENNIDLLKYDVIGNIVTDILLRIADEKKVVLVFEDIQWMDSISLSLLSSFITCCKSNNIMFLITCRNEFNAYIDRFFAATRKYDKVQTIELCRFNTIEAQKFINEALPEYSLSKDMINKIYEQTEGNTFFLTEYLNIIKWKKDINIMTSKVQDVLKSRFLDISEEEKRIVEVTSLFHDGVPMFILRELLQKDELQIIDIIEQLEHKFILEEISNESDIRFKFTHQKLREFQYINLSQAKKKILHNKVGKLLENTLKMNNMDISIYHKLIYHFENANNYLAALKYKIKNLNIYLNFSHELFPVIYYNDKCFNKLYVNDTKTIKKLTEIEHDLHKLKNEEGNYVEVLKLEVSVLHIQGRYFIRKGEYDEGMKNIKEMIEKAKEIKSEDYVIEGYKQIIYYCIQTNNVDEMIKYVNCAIELAKEHGYENEIGILLRLKALYKKLIGEYEEAEDLINQSIDIISKSKNLSDQYALNIAGCYNYIGDIRKKTGKFVEALKYYNKAVEICEGKYVLTSVALFHTNAGEAAFYIDDYELAAQHFKKALSIYNQFDFIWGKSIAEGFMSLISINNKELDEALKYLKSADFNSKALKNPKEIGTVFRVKAEIKSIMKYNNSFGELWNLYLDKDSNQYICEGIKYLKEARDEYQIDILNKL